MSAVQKIFQMYGPQYLALYGERVPQSHKKTIRDIMACRKGAFGTMVYECRDCRNLHFIHCCCGNRHCPNCQQNKADQLLNQQMKKLLPTHYFLLTITLPQSLRNVVRSHQKQSYGALFSCTNKALKKAGLLNKIDPAVWQQQWVIDSQPVGQGQNSLRYLSRYVFRVAISNNRIKSIENGVVKFLYKDRKKKKWKITALNAMEFIRRFLQHVLPKSFMKIRHSGFLNPGSALPL